MNYQNQCNHDELRHMHFQLNYLAHPKGSVLVSMGETRVICTVSIVQRVPRWMREQNIGGGWLTSEYQMHPASTPKRRQREGSTGRVQGRSHEIQRLIGRVLRTVIDLQQIGDNTIYIDCDVIDADGGTRCAAINGGMLALELACRKMLCEGSWKQMPIKDRIGAVSVGIVNGKAVLDLSYIEDANASVDMNVVMNTEAKFIEIQGSSEQAPFSDNEMQEMLSLAKKGIQQIITLQKEALKALTSL